MSNALSLARLRQKLLSAEVDVSGRTKRRYYVSEACSGAALVVTNLPYMTHLPPAFFVDYVDAMTDGLGAVLLVRGSGQEVVTKYG